MGSNGMTEFISQHSHQKLKQIKTEYKTISFI